MDRYVRARTGKPIKFNAALSILNADASLQIQRTPASIGRRILAANGPRKLTRVRALAGIFLVVGMRATLLAHTLATEFRAKCRALGRDGTGGALAVGFSNDFGAHGSLYL